MKEFTVQQILVGKVSTTKDAQFVNATCSVTLVEEIGNGNGKSVRIRMLVDCASSYEREKLERILQTHGIAPHEITHLVITHWHFDHCGNIGLFPNAQLITPERILAEGPERINADLPECISVHLYGGHSTPGDVIVKVKQTKKEQDDKFVPWITAIVGDLFEFENDWMLDQPWKQCSICPDRQLISRFLCWKGSDEIIPGHGPSFRLSGDFPEKSSFGLFDLKLKRNPSEKRHESCSFPNDNAIVSLLISDFVIDEQHKKQKVTVYLVKGIGGEIVLVNTGGPGQGQALIEALNTHGIASDEVKHLVITNLGVQFCHNLHLFKNAQAFMATDLAFPDSIYGSLDKLFIISPDISIWRDMDPIRDAGTLAVLVRTVHEKGEYFTLIGSKLDAFIPTFLDITKEDIEFFKVMQLEI